MDVIWGFTGRESFTSLLRLKYNGLSWKNERWLFLITALLDLLEFCFVIASVTGCPPWALWRGKRGLEIVSLALNFILMSITADFIRILVTPTEAEALICYIVNIHRLFGRLWRRKVLFMAIRDSIGCGLWKSCLFLLILVLRALLGYSSWSSKCSKRFTIQLYDALLLLLTPKMVWIWICGWQIAATAWIFGNWTFKDDHTRSDLLSRFAWFFFWGRATYWSNWAIDRHLWLLLFCGLFRVAILTNMHYHILLKSWFSSDRLSILKSGWTFVLLWKPGHRDLVHWSWPLLFQSFALLDFFHEEFFVEPRLFDVNRF